MSAYWPTSWSVAARARQSDQIAGANTIDAQTRVVKYQPLYSRVKAADGGVILQFASLSINAGSDHEAAMRFVSASTEPFQVGDLPGLRPEQQTDLARTLIVSGFPGPVARWGSR